MRVAAHIAVISLLHGTHDELSSIFVMAYCHFMLVGWLC